MVVLWWGWSVIVQQRGGGAWMPGSPLGGRWVRDPRSGGGFARNSRNTSLGAKLLLGSDAMSRLCVCILADKNISWLVQEAAIGQVVDSQGMWMPDMCDMCVCAGSIQHLPIRGHWGG